MPLWQSLLFVSVIPSLGAVVLIALSYNYRSVEISLVTLGAGAIGLVIGQLTVGQVVIAWGGHEEDGRRYLKRKKASLKSDFKCYVQTAGSTVARLQVGWGFRRLT